MAIGARTDDAIGSLKVRYATSGQVHARAVLTRSRRIRRYPLWLAATLKLAQPLLVWHFLKQLLLHAKTRPTDISRDPIEQTMRLLSQYAGIVAATGFDSAAAAQFKADHAEDEDFVRKAAMHDRIVFQAQRAKEAAMVSKRGGRGR